MAACGAYILHITVPGPMLLLPTPQCERKHVVEHRKVFLFLHCSACMPQNTTLTTMTEAVKLFDPRTTGYVSWRCLLVAVLLAGVPAVLSASAQQLLEASVALAQGSADGKLTEQDFVQVRPISSLLCRRLICLHAHVFQQHRTCSCHS